MSEIKKPRGIRNNNPLNIVRTADKWVGLKSKHTDPRFCEFTDLSLGYRAAFIILKKYIVKHGWNTIEKIISHWAPECENDLNMYITSVCKFMDEQKDHEIDINNMEDMLMLVSAMTVVENGKDYNPQQRITDLWRPMYYGYKMALGEYNPTEIAYSPELHHAIYDIETQESMAEQRWKNMIS